MTDESSHREPIGQYSLHSVHLSESAQTSAAPRIWRWATGGSMHLKVGGQYSENTNIW